MITGTYILKDHDRGYKRLLDQPWPVTEEIVERWRLQGYVLQTTEETHKRAFFEKVDTLLPE
jgi:hypothetical protein